MTDAISPATVNPPPLTIPQKRPLPVDERHTPTVASPLNPNARVREERTKKPTAKARKDSPEPSAAKKNTKKAPKTDGVQRPIRYKLDPPRIADYEAPLPPTLVPVTEVKGQQFFEATEIVNNRKGFRYSDAIADPRFPSSLYNRQSEAPPYGARISFEDASAQVLFSHNSITTEKGFRMGRANVGVREGRWYYECRIVKGVKPPDSPEAGEIGGHVRVGWARREASLEGPVGYDAYSYGIRDVGGQKVTRSRPVDFAASDLCEGDVIGLEITLPSLSLHRKVVEGVYNKAVDTADDLDPAASAEAPDIIRDRVIYHHRSRLYFEAYEYQPTKPLEDYMNPTPPPAKDVADVDEPHPNHSCPQLRTLPFSNIKVYKNGVLLGAPFENLLAFLPPASGRNPQQVGEQSRAENLDDGMLGYYPAVSVFRGGTAETNFGPNFWCPPPDLATDEDVEMSDAVVDQAAHARGSNAKLRPLSERYDEQIAEDIVYDIIDEVDFWALDGGEAEGAMKDLSEVGPASRPPVEMDNGAAVVMEGRKPAPMF